LPRFATTVSDVRVPAGLMRRMPFGALVQALPSWAERIVQSSMQPVPGSEATVVITPVS